MESSPASFSVRDAVDALKDRSNSEIFGFLTFARSIKPGFQYCSSSGCLPVEVVNAVSIFRDWSDEVVLRSLQRARGDGAQKSLMQGDLRRGISSSGGLDPLVIANKIPRSLNPNPFRIATAFDNNRNHGTSLNTTRSRARKRKLGNPEHLYWCTVCGFEDPHSYRGSDQWKKHEKEHENTFDCLLGGLLDVSGEGDVCTFCGKPWPDNEHFREHNVDPCLKAPKGPPTFKRRYEMMSHLEGQHACTNSEALAEKWRSSPQKQAWSCGFCVALFTSLPDRLKHIGMEHFDQGQTLHEWSPTKVIEGLLLQPEINEAWLAFLNKLDTCSRQNLSWNNIEMPSLQARLEMGVTTSEMAEELAQATYDVADPNPHINFQWASDISTTKEKDDPSTKFQMPPPIAKRARIVKKSRRPESITSITDSTENSLPTAQSATGSWYPAAIINPFLLYSGSSVSDNPSDTESFRSQWPETYHRDNGGLATPFSDDGVKQRYQSLQSFMDDVDAIAQKDAFDGLVTDQEQYNVGMQI